MIILLNLFPEDGMKIMANILIFEKMWRDEMQSGEPCEWDDLDCTEGK